MIIDKGNGTAKPWHGGPSGLVPLLWMLAIALGAGVIAVTVALSLGGGGSSTRLAAGVTATHGQRRSLAGDIQAFLRASSVQQVQCTRSGTERSCQVAFSDAYGTWSATLVVARHNVVSDPGGNANWLCTSACAPLPKTTGLPRSAGTANYGKTFDHENNGVVYGSGNSRASSGTGAPAGTYAPTTPGAYTPTTPGAYTPTTPGVYTPTTPGVYTPTTPGVYTPTTPGVYTPTTPGVYTPTTPGVYTPTTPGVYTPTTPGG